MEFVREARRRKVWVTAAAYGALTVGLIEISGAVSEALLFPDWTGRLVTFLLLLGFPIVVVMAWIFDIDHGRIRRTSAIAEEGSPGAGARPDRPARKRFTGSTSVPIPAAPVRRTVTQPASSSVESEPLDPDRLKRVALGHVRHELRTPINAILGYSEMLLEDEEDADIVADLRRINESGRRLLSLVDGILDPARLEGAIDREIESFAAQIEADLRTPINAVVGYCEMLLEDQRESGRDELVPDLERILSASRSLLATSGEIVQVATRAPGADGTRTMSRLQDSSDLTREVLAKLPTASVGNGRDIPSRQGSLLVVDDNPTNRDLLTRQLARHGYIVDAAADGKDALDKLASRDFDLILLDVIMPGMDGVETLRRLKEDERLRDIPVIMLSSLDEVESAVRCIEAGAEEYITKPVQATLLEARIAANLEVRDLRAREHTYRKRIDADAETIDQLLLSAFPTAVAERVQRGESGILDTVPATTVLHCLADQTRFGSGGIPEYVMMLSDWFSAFTALSDEQEIDVCLGHRTGFTAAAWHDEGNEAAISIAELALAFQAALGRDGPESATLFRLGMHTGSTVSAVIGRSRPRFDLWGEAVVTAGSLAGGADPGRILVSPATSVLLKDRFSLETGRVVEIEGLGQMRPHVLHGSAHGDAGIE
jgi:CheY-like chemotaxis protein/signal transduction histidine kinase